MQDAAKVAGVTPRTVQRALGDGTLGMARVLGRQITTDDLALQAWIRTKSPGRKWSARTRDAALTLLSNKQGDRLSASERSRLRAALRTMSARHIAALCWSGTWARYRRLRAFDICLIGPSAISPSMLGLVAGESWITFAETQDLDTFERTQPVIADPDGDLVVIERPHDSRRAITLIDTYVLGDARESTAAAEALEVVAHAL